MTVAMTVCFTIGLLFFTAGCENDDGKSGTQYRYESDSYADIYNLYDDGTYEREYEGSDYTGRVALETGTYSQSSSSLSFKIERQLEGTWPSGALRYGLLIGSYSGTLRDEYMDIRDAFTLSSKRYEKHGSVYTSD